MKSRILILDDQIQYGRSLDRALRNEYDLILASSLSEAIEMLTPDLDVVLADVRLDESKNEDRQGIEFVAWARSHLQNLIIISMSALEDESLEVDAINAGADKFLRKPIVISQLKTMLAEMLQK